MLPFTLLVNSTDSYSDCWDPFFTLMKAYWSDYQGPVYLNTETREYTFPSIDIRPTHAQAGAAIPGERPTWSECLTHSLLQIPTDIVLYCQEDYFLKANVDTAALVSLTQLMEARKLTYLSIVDFGNRGPFTPASFDERLCQVSQKDAYRISLQACLISKSRFMRYIRRHENPWQFEYYGNMRARRIKDEFYTINRTMYPLATNPIFPYDPTGVVSKKWKQDVVEELFARHNIDVDYAKRGWYVRGENPAPPRKITLNKIISTLKSII
jgi:hypothetical protein